MKQSRHDVLCPHCHRMFNPMAPTPERQKEMYVYDPSEDDEPHHRDYGPLYIMLALLSLILLTMMIQPASAQQLHDENLRGPHPMQGQPDPYAKTMSVSKANCCHGKDCSRYHGEPVRVSGGWQFGKWFLPDRNLIDTETLPPSERGFHQLCVRNNNAVCGHVAMGY